MHYFKVDTFISSAKILRIGKSDGCDGLTSDYILNGSRLLYTVIMFPFNCILLHGYVPSSFCISTLIQIPKNKLASLSNYSRTVRYEQYAYSGSVWFMKNKLDIVHECTHNWTKHVLNGVSSDTDYAVQLCVWELC